MKQLVIDASIAHAAGITDFPTSRNCRVFLDTMRETADCGCIFNPDLRAEWKSHASLYATKWLANMYSRRRVINQPPAKDDGLRKCLVHCAADIAGQDPVQTQAVAAALCKDAHLLESASASLREGRRIASLDEKVRGHLRVCAAGHAVIRGIVWVNPDIENEQASNWVLAGAPLERRRMLGHQS